MKLTREAIILLSGLTAFTAGFGGGNAEARPSSDSSARRSTARGVVQRVVWDDKTHGAHREVLTGKNYAGLTRKSGFLERERQIVCGGNDTCPEVVAHRKGRDRIVGLNEVQYLGSLLSAPFTGKASLDIFGITGTERGRARRKHFSAVAKGLPGVADGTVLRYLRDMYDKTHYKFVEFGNVSNMIGNLNNTQAARLVRANQHTNETPYDPNRVFVLRYRSDVPAPHVYSFSANGGDKIKDILYLCRDDASDCRNMPHLARVGSQSIDLPGPYVLRHIMIEPLDNPIRVYDANSQAYQLTRGVFVVPRDLYGKPVKVKIAKGDVSDDVPDPDDDVITDNDDPIDDDDLDDDDKDDDKKDDDDKDDDKKDDDLEDRTARGTKNGWPDWYLSLSGVGLANDFAPSTYAGFKVGLGKEVTENLSLGILLGYLYGGSESGMGPQTRRTEPNPLDPRGFTGIVEDKYTTVAHMISAGLELRYRIGRVQLVGSADLYVPLIHTENDLNVRTELANGYVGDSEDKHSSSLDKKVLGGASGGISVNLTKNLGLHAKCGGAAGSGAKVYGCEGGLTFTFGKDE